MYYYITDLLGITSYQKKLIANPDAPIGFDTETTGLDPFTATMLLVQCDVEGDQFIFDARKLGDKLTKYVIEIAQSREMIGFNLKFDIKMIKQKYGIMLENLWDIQIAEVMSENGLSDDRYPTMEFVTAKYLGIQLDKTVRTTFYDPNWDGVITQAQIQYAAEDVMHLKKLKGILEEKIIKQKQKKTLANENKLIPVNASMELNGIYVDKTAWSNLEEYAAVNQKLVEVKIKEYIWDKIISIKSDSITTLSGLCMLFAIPVKTKKLEKLVKETSIQFGKDWFLENLNIGSPLQMKKILSFLGINVADTNEDTLTQYENENGKNEFISFLLEFRDFKKKHTTYGSKFLENVNPVTGRIHCNFNSLGTACLPKGELVLTNLGYLPVEKVIVGMSVISHTGRVNKVTDSFLNNPQQIIKVTLDNGLSLRTSNNHPYYLEDKSWKNAENLSIGDSVVVLSDQEQWKVINDWPRYSISSWGRVKNIERNKIIYPSKKGVYGHHKISLRRNNSTKIRDANYKDLAVHRLVAKAFIDGETELRNEVRHLDGIAWNNSIENLAWGTSKENKADSILHGSYHSNRTGKLTLDMVKAILETPIEVSDSKLGKQLNVSRKLINDIRHRRRWKDLRDSVEKIAVFHTSKVKSIEVQGFEVTYGLEVERDHSHVTGGIVTHNTGRYSSSSPNLQQIPRDKQYRKCFKAEDGWTLVTLDYSQQEYRLVGWTTQEPKIIEAYKLGKDMHTATAALEMSAELGREVDFSEVTKEKRNNAKMHNFLTLYGGGAYGLAAKSGMSLEEAEFVVNTITSGYPTMVNFRKEFGEWCYANKKSQTLLGRTRFFRTKPIYANIKQMDKEKNAIMREGYNMVIQGTGSEIAKLALMRLYYENPFGENYKILLTVHDEIVAEVREEYAQEAFEFQKRIMEEEEQKFLGEIPAVVEGKISKEWEH